MTDRRPWAVIRAAGVDDLAPTIGFPGGTELPLAVRGGGHNTAGNGIVDHGLVLNLDDLPAVSVEPAAALTAMASACASLDGALHLVPGEERGALAGLVGDGDRAQSADPAWRRELADWMHPRRRGDGRTVPPVIGAATRLVVSRVDVGARTAGRNETLTREAPAGSGRPRRTGR